MENKKLKLTVNLGTLVLLFDSYSQYNVFITGPRYSFFLLMYDQSHKTIKKRVRVKDIVTIRAGKHSSFQVYLNSGMFILFRADSVESQTAWMAELKMALGRGKARQCS